ncbi:ABC transporter permease [Olsenella sp. AF16-14LB]|jgi:simple sugar transport system permease protein|uniref:ABC transporter permease n=1 Tax=Tractidigestivibacter scatoligenes TaxID=1299998 RepID=A0A100YW18_TRASO|nr:MULTISPECIES: ABC transporter permease [Atopobiaceae]KUH58725.1 ABC transporter permease [Tractidigestivibacter scatoligenes]RGJ45830.1 ABC transporter permease [Olsenella sp. TM06-36]RGU51985.1 ABC transporter permease [Olsenella sp. AF16-14LB]RGU83433.1 ABC transporter permease [Olsenella sp. AF15-43LB]
MDLLASILYDTVYHAAPIILCVIGGVFAYQANVLNIALEGMMGIGAFASTLTVYFTNSLVLGLLAGVLAALIFGAIFSVMGVTLRGNVIIIGVALNLLVTAIAGFVMVRMNVANISLSSLNVSDLQIIIPGIDAIPILGPIVSGHPILTYVAFIGIWLMWVLSYRTKFGTYVRVVGENEDAAKSLGLKTNFYKIVAILIGALTCGLAGINLSTERLGLYTNGMTAGRGFVAIAAIYCGRGDPLKSSLYAILFGFARSLSINLAIYAGPASGLFDVIPYVVMVVVLLVVQVSKRRNVRTRGFANG